MDFFSDSLSVLIAMSSTVEGLNRAPIILNIKEKAWSLHKMGKEIEFWWIPAHRGIGPNERVDALAKEAADGNGRETDLLIPTSDFTALWKSYLNEDLHKWCAQEGLHKGKDYFQRYCEKNRKPWFSRSNHTRGYITTVNRLRANHYSLAENLYRYKLVESPKCKCGGNEESINHIVWQCPMYSKERKALLQEIRKGRIYGPLCIEEFLYNPDGYVINLIISFLNRCKLKI